MLIEEICISYYHLVATMLVPCIGFFSPFYEVPSSMSSDMFGQLYAFYKLPGNQAVSMLFLKVPRIIRVYPRIILGSLLLGIENISYLVYYNKNKLTLLFPV